MNGCENCVNGFVKYYPDPARALYNLVKCKFCNTSVKAHMKTVDGTRVPETHVPEEHIDKCKIVSIENREDIVALMYRNTIIGWTENPVKQAVDFQNLMKVKSF